MEKLSLVSLQSQMMDFLTDSEMAIADHIVDQGNITKAVRLNIYQNAYFQRLKEVIDNDHQKLGLYLGDDLFDTLAKGYVKQYPSNVTSLRHYSDNIPTFLSENEPFSSHPVLAELAHFERLLLTAFDAADTEIFTLPHLQEISHDEWPTLVFRLHPSVQLAHYQFNAVESWQALQSEKSPEAAFKQPNTWLLWRNVERLTEFRSLSDEELGLIHLILKGENFSTLCEFLAENSNEEDTTSLAFNYLLTWIGQGLFRR